MKCNYCDAEISATECPACGVGYPISSDDSKDKVETLIGYLKLWYSKSTPPHELLDVIKEADEWLKIGK